MDETVIETFDDVKFIQGVTKMNQTNWQKYFGTVIPNGVYSGLMVQDYYGEQTFSYPTILTDGSVFVNGLYAEVKTEEGFTDISTASAQGLRDRFICLRVWLNEPKAEIIQKSNIAEAPGSGQTWETTTTIELAKFVADESYCCERNDFYWDVPLFYNSEETGTIRPLQSGRSLRRIVDLSHKRQINPVLHGIKHRPTQNYILMSGSNLYSGNTYNGVVNLFLDDLDMPFGAVYSIAALSSSGMTINLHNDIWTNSAVAWDYYTRYTNKNFIFNDPTEWTHTSSNTYTLNVSANDSPYLVFSMLYENRGSQAATQTVKVEVIHDNRN